MRIAFWTWPAAGHLNPMTTLARAVRERGHEVFFLGLPDCEAIVRSAGFEFHPYAEQQFPVGFRQESEAQMSKLSGMAGVRFVAELAKRGLNAAIDEAPRVLRQAKADAMVADQVAVGGCLISGSLNLPLIHVCNALPIHRYDSIPPFLFGWPYRPGFLGRLRNRLGYAFFRHLSRSVRELVCDRSRRLGVPFDPMDHNSVFSKLAQVSQLPAEFDFPNPELPPWFHYSGPFHDGLGRPHVEFPWNRLTGEPLIYASMGTIQNGSEHVFRTIAQACSGLGCQLVMSLGPNIGVESLGLLPPNAIAVGHAPQLELLRRATLCITHAGLNTALESLAAGVPMVAVPVTNDQPAVAARIAYTGTGTVVPYRRVHPDRLAQAVRTVLEDGRYREKARRLQAAIQAAKGLERAAEIIDACLRSEGGNPKTTRPAEGSAPAR
jgi:UDP:flavonoid glycosyltransferase YjiC (YdhE family)